MKKSIYVFFSNKLMKEQADDIEKFLWQLQLGQRIRKGLDKNKREIEERKFAIFQEYEKISHS